MCDINYSFLIPHKNSPDLLNRCVNSIPRRDDVEIIVLDDNSDIAVINWDEFAFDNKECINLIKNKEGRGQGYLRNIGISIAHGKWLVFPDADDYYSNGFLDILDRYKDLQIDVLYFNANIIKGDSTSTINYISDYSGDELSLKRVKYRFNAAWCKMVRREFAIKYNVMFDTIRAGEDAIFTYLIGYFAKNCKVEKTALYNYISSPKSITLQGVSDEMCKQLIINSYRQNAFADYINFHELKVSIIRSLFSSLLRKRIDYTSKMIKAYLAINKGEYELKYVDEIQSRINKSKK